jgi:hypothetical protein
LVDGEIENGIQAFAWSVFPPNDRGGFFEVQGPPGSARAIVEADLFGRSTRDELWAHGSLVSDLGSVVRLMMRDGEAFMHFDFAALADEEPARLVHFAPLPAETILPRRDGFEQFYSGADEVQSGGRPVDKEHLVEFKREEILHLKWPLELPRRQRSPVEQARRLGSVGDEWSALGLLSIEVPQYPLESMLPVVRARLGRYAGYLDRMKDATLRAADAVYAARTEGVTEFFMLDRVLRNRLAVAQVRDFVVKEFNQQVMRVWCRRNNWPWLGLAMRVDFFGVEDWTAMRDELERGTLSNPDVAAAIALETEAVRAAGLVLR